MTKHLKVLASLSVVSAALTAVVALKANDSRAAFEGVWRTVGVSVGGPAPQSRRDAGHLSREPLQPRGRAKGRIDLSGCC